MFLIVLFTIIGFLIGLAYVMIKRKIRPGNMLAATFLGLLAAAIWKMIKDYNQNKDRYI